MTRWPEERYLSDGTHVTLYRNESLTLEDQTKLQGDWMIVLKPHDPRVVVFIFEHEGNAAAKMAYDTHTLKHPEDSSVLPLGKLDYVLHNIDDKVQEEKYLNYRRIFDQQSA
jgi:hypothetical protein